MSPELVMTALISLVAPLMTQYLKRFTSLDEENPGAFTTFATAVNTIICLVLMVGVAFAFGFEWQEWVQKGLVAAGLGTTGYNIIRGFQGGNPPSPGN